MLSVWLLMLFGDILAGYRPYGVAPPSEGYTPVIYREQEQLEELVKQQCRYVTGTSRTFRKLDSFGRQDTVKCIRQHVKYPEIPLYELLLQNKMLETVCSQVEKAIFDCIDPLLEKIEPCMYDEDSVKAIQTIADALPEALKMICEDTRALLFVLFDPRAKSCVTKVALNINNCTGLVDDEATAIYFEDYSLKQCIILRNIQRCYYDMTSDCEAPVIQKLLTLFNNKVRSLTPCEQVMEDL